MENYRIMEFTHNFMKNHIKEGDFCIDGTMGNGTDTLFLCDMVGESGEVLAFDIQKQAIDNTKKLLEENKMEDRAKLILDSHEKIAEYVNDTENGYEKAPTCIVYNFGYLPGGDKALQTKPETSIKAIEASLEILDNGGLLSLCIYSGKENGMEEKEEILKYLKTLDTKKYLVILFDYYNRPNNPPLPAMVIKL